MRCPKWLFSRSCSLSLPANRVREHARLEHKLNQVLSIGQDQLEIFWSMFRVSGFSPIRTLKTRIRIHPYYLLIFFLSNGTLKNWYCTNVLNKVRISTTNLLCSLCLANIRPSSNLMRCKWCSFFSYLLFYCRAFFMNPDPDFSDPDLDSGKKRSGAGQKDPDPKHWFWWGAHDKDFSFGGIFSFILIAIFHNYYFKLMKTGVFPPHLCITCFLVKL